MKVYKWKDLEGKFKKSILLGNGASIAIDRSFSYSSLFENARQNELISANMTKIFKHLKTEDFELVLRMLWHAYHINKALEIDDAKTSAAYEGLRAALIHAIRKIHVEYAEVCDRLLPIATFLKQFKTVVSLNYDFLVYWAMLAGNTEWGANWFKDCFIDHGEFKEDWKWLREPDQNADGSTLVFYPHGNLALAVDLFGRETKIATEESATLMDRVVKKWKSGEYSPLFVSEGTSSQKLQAIKRSPYLNNVYKRALADLGSEIVIFGWSFGEQDEHILNALCKNSKPTTIAVSVLPSSQVDEKCRHIQERVREATGNGKVQVFFFDRESKGCWANPE